MPLDGSTYDTDETRWLMEGRENLLRSGWCQNAAQGHGAAACMLSALPVWGREQQPLARVEHIFVEAIADPSFHNVAAFNDMPGRTLEEVIAVYNRAIEISRRAA